MKKLIMTMMLLAGLVTIPTVMHAQSVVGEEISAVDQTPSAAAVSGGLELNTNSDTACHFYIYSITGQMVKSMEVSGNTYVELPRGCYIVKCKSWSKKIVVK